MATAGKTTICKEVVTRVNESTYTLTLSENEVKLLMTVLGAVGGDPDMGPRYHADEIYNALNEQGANKLGKYEIQKNSNFYFPTYAREA